MATRQLERRAHPIWSSAMKWNGESNKPAHCKERGLSDAASLSSLALAQSVHHAGHDRRPPASPFKQDLRFGRATSLKSNTA